MFFAYIDANGNVIDDVQNILKSLIFVVLKLFNPKTKISFVFVIIKSRADTLFYDDWILSLYKLILQWR